MPTEKQLDQAFESAVSSDATFCQWFLSRTKLGSEYPRLVLSRSNHPWGKVSLLLPNPETGALEVVEREGETDVLLVFEGANANRLGIHIENKRASGSFTSYQPEVCAARAHHWFGNPSYGAYHLWETVLLAPRSFYERNLAHARKFTTFISHEDLSTFVPSFRL